MHKKHRKGICQEKRASAVAYIYGPPHPKRTSKGVLAEYFIDSLPFCQ
jgi:hypothetical protein